MTTENQAPEGAQVAALRQALEDAATSLETVAKNAGRVYDTDGYENLLEHHDQVRGYAASRASAARAALAAQPQAPLSERAILDLVPSNMPLSNDFELLWFARAVERAHGIQAHKEPTNDR